MQNLHLFMIIETANSHLFMIMCGHGFFSHAEYAEPSGGKFSVALRFKQFCVEKLRNKSSIIVFFPRPIHFFPTFAPSLRRETDWAEKRVRSVPKSRVPKSNNIEVAN